jgi:hypothetical protein
MLLQSDRLSTCTALTQAEIDWLVAHLFDKDPPTLWRASVPVPFYTKNPPPAVRVPALSDVLYLHC